MKMNMTPRAKKLLAGLTAAALTLSMLPATALAAKDYATGGETALRFSNSGITVQEGDYDGYKIDGTVNTLADTEQNNDETYPDNDSAENAVIKCKDGSQVTLCGSGTLNVTANGKNGVKSGATTDEEGAASLTISAGDDALHCDLSLTVGASGTAGPDIDITGCYEGIEAANLAIRSGDIDITATDDCLNAANSDLTGYSFTMDISGSTINAYTSGGDGFDSNGSLTISGGVIAVWTANTADNQPLDVSQTGSIGGFADNSSVSGYARTAMAWANGAGLISGMGDNTLAPRGTATQGQAAVILMGLDKLAGL